MSKFIKTRTSSQCRTHHQKVMEKSSTVGAAINSYTDKNNKFFDHYKEIKSSLELLDDFDFCGTKYNKVSPKK